MGVTNARAKVCSIQSDARAARDPQAFARFRAQGELWARGETARLSENIAVNSDGISRPPASSGTDTHTVVRNRFIKAVQEIQHPGARSRQPYAMKFGTSKAHSLSRTKRNLAAATVGFQPPPTPRAIARIAVVPAATAANTRCREVTADSGRPAAGGLAASFSVALRGRPGGGAVLTARATLYGPLSAQQRAALEERLPHSKRQGSQSRC